MKVHFIALGGSAMHNLAIALHKKGYQVSGSDDQIFDPARSRLAEYGLLPAKLGWHPQRVHQQLDGVILGMHAREDNPELQKARQLRLKIWSFPEYLYEQTHNKKRVVIGGSHGKTTITAMVMHVLRYAGIAFDYMVGAYIEGFETMVGLSREAKIAVFEGDEYLASSIDPRPKFHLYKPHIAVISGIAWDHINVFPTFEQYLHQFELFAKYIEPRGSLIYYEEDHHVADLAGKARSDIGKTPYREHPRSDNGNYLKTPRGEEVAFQLFGRHNAANARAALEVSRKLGLSDELFYQAMATFTGASQRLQKLVETPKAAVYLDFAHAPSKLKATIAAVKEHYPRRTLIACMELHTFSSLNKNFLHQYHHTMQQADQPIVYFNPETIRHKKLEMIHARDIQNAFNDRRIRIYQDSNQLVNDLLQTPMDNKVLLMMTSGNFNGTDLHRLASRLLTPA